MAQMQTCICAANKNTYCPLIRGYEGSVSGALTRGGEKWIGRKVGGGGWGGDDTKCEKVSLLKLIFCLEV
jgi:hypothetical protein